MACYCVPCRRRPVRNRRVSRLTGGPVITLPTNATAAIMMAVHHQRNDAMGSASFRSAIPRSMRSRAASWPASYAQTLIRDRESLAMNIRDSACLFGNTGSPIRSMAWDPVNGSRRLQRRAFERKDGGGWDI